MATDLAEGELVLVLARVRTAYRSEGVATLRIITPGSEGGRGYQQIIAPFDAVYCRLEDAKHDCYAPPVDWC